MHLLSPSLQGLPAADDVDVDIILRRYLVHSLYDSPRGSYAAMVMNCAVIFSAWHVSQSQALFACFLGSAAIDFLRCGLIYTYARWPKPSQMPQHRVIFYRWSYQILSTVLYAILGTASYLLIAMEDAPSMALAVSITVGYAFASVARNSGQLSVFGAQVCCITIPAAIGFATASIPNGWTYAILFFVLVAYTSVMAAAANKKIIAYFHANYAMRRMARNDMLTGLLNRYALSEELTSMLAGFSDTDGGRFAIIMIDLDRFKEVNDTLGHSAGDAVIVEVAKQIRKIARPQDVVARIGGDEFIVLARTIRSDSDFGEFVADRIHELASRPLTIGAATVSIGASVGITYFPDHGTSSEDLIKKADIALYEAKRRGGNTWQTFDCTLQKAMNDRLQLEIDIERGLQAGEFEPWFQPIQNIATGETVSFEALARWRHPDRGMVPPGEFIAAAEHCGAIVAIGQVILERACRQAVTWSSQQSVAVNLSPAQFRDSEALVANIKHVLHTTGLAPSRLHLEITESLLMADTDKTRLSIDELSELGVQFSLDDFGTGYSSMAYIQNYPLSKIKIDKKFIDHIDTDRKSRAIVGATRLLASEINMEVVAEGVETPKQHDALVELGITLVQGYLYGRPQPIALGTTRAVANVA